MPLCTFELSESNVEAELPVLKYKCQLENPANHVKFAYIQFDSIDSKPHNWFARVETFILKQPSIGHSLEMTGFQWSTWMLLTLGSKLPGLHMDADYSQMYIPIPLAGFNSNFKDHPVEIEIYYNKFEQDDDRTRVQIISVPTEQVYTGAIEFSDLDIANLDSDKETFDLDLSNFVPSTRRVKSVVFYLPKAGMWLKSGELLLNGVLVNKFDKPYDAMIMDKLENELLNPKMPLFTLSFTNWATNINSDAAEQGLEVAPGSSLVLRLNFNLHELVQDPHVQYFIIG